MTQSFDELKRYAIADILSVSGKDKATRVIENHMNNLIEIALIKGAQSKQAEIDEYKEVAESMEDAYLREKSKVDELQKRIDDALKAMEAESENSWGLWKEKADMYEQGASNAYEKSYWILKGTTNEQ